ncbi:MAG: isoprenylcysteine carboxylmethyltransferase family protein [Anaerolineaceae bacterium]
MVTESVTSSTSGRIERLRYFRRLGSMTQDAALVVLSAFFFYIHARHVFIDHDVTSVFFAVEQALLVGVFLARRRSYVTSVRPGDWIVASLGGWLPLALQPSGGAPGGVLVFGTVVQMLGLTLTCYGFWSLGRSFGVVAANRGIKTRGPYRIVRHPIYFSHSITMGGFLLANPSALNAVLLAVITGFQLLRIRAEERVLTESGDYGAYAGQVRWRLVPGLY